MAKQCMCEQPGTTCPLHDVSPAVPDLLCNWFYAYVIGNAYVMGKWAWISEWNMETAQSGRQCALPYGHDAEHALVGGLGHEVPRATSDALRERAREMPGAAAARRRVYAEDERRRAARALDRYVSIVFEPGSAKDLESAFAAAGNEFVERVGDYVLSRLQQKSHYGASDLCSHGFIADGQACAEFGCREPAEWCSCAGDSPTRRHPRGVYGCAHVDA